MFDLGYFGNGALKVREKKFNGLHWQMNMRKSDRNKPEVEYYVGNCLHIIYHKGKKMWISFHEGRIMTVGRDKRQFIPAHIDL